MSINPNWLPPEHLSPSQVSTLLTCGEQYRLTRVEHVPERPMWAGIGGSAVHLATEHRDRQLYAGEEQTPAEEAFKLYWEQAHDEAKQFHPEFEDEDYYCSGRVSKEWPKKENPDWWAVKGPAFIDSWSLWLKESDLSFWEYADETGELQPGIEVPAWAYLDNEGELLVVQSHIDRVLVDGNGTLYIVDIKTGSMTPAFPMQMALNNLGLEHQHGAQAAYAGFWSARKGGVASWTPLERYSSEWLWEQVWKAKQIRDQQLFIPQPGNLCNSACGVRQHCVAMGGTPFVKE